MQTTLLMLSVLLHHNYIKLQLNKIYYSKITNAALKGQIKQYHTQHVDEIILFF